MRAAFVLALVLEGATCGWARTEHLPSAGASFEVPGSWLTALEGRRLTIASPDRSIEGFLWVPVVGAAATQRGARQLLGFVETSDGLMATLEGRALAPAWEALAAELGNVVDGPRITRAWISVRGPAGLEALGHGLAHGVRVGFKAGLLATTRPIVFIFFSADPKVLTMRMTQVSEMIACLRIDESVVPAEPPPRGGLAARVERLRQRAGVPP